MHADNFWEELGTVAGTGSSANLDISFTSKKYLMGQYWISNGEGANFNAEFRVGNSTIDTGSNYAYRYSSNGAADVTATSETKGVLRVVGGNDPVYGVFYIVNNSANEKLMINHSNSLIAAGAGTAPSRNESIMKWTNTSNQIDIIRCFINGGSCSTNSIFTLWGSD